MPTEKAHGLQIVRMCEAFAGAGVTTTLLHPARFQPGALRGEDALQYYGVRMPFTIRTLPNVDIVRTEPWLPARAYTVAHFAHSVAWAWYAARRAPRLAPADLYMCRDVTVAAALLRRGVPVVLEIHKAPERWSLRLLRQVVRRPNLRLLITMTASLRAALAERGVAAPNTIVLHDGVDVERYECAPQPAWPPGAPVVLYAGHLFREKGIETLVAAARLLEGVDVKIAGGMPQHIAAWRARLAEAGPRNVQFLGHLPPDRMPAVQKAADVLALPNSGRHLHSSRYTSPMKLFEYMAAGRPIVASDVPAVREVLQHDVNAWLVRPDDPHALADGVRLLLHNGLRRTRLGRQAAADSRKYSWKNRAHTLVEVAGYVPDPVAAAPALFGTQ